MHYRQIIPLVFRSCIVVMAVTLCSTSYLAGQQKVHFTQYMFNGLILNPACAGMDEALSLTFLNRSQWSKVEGAPTTQTLSAHTLFNNQHVGVGLSLINDKIGIHKNRSASASFAYHLNVAKEAYFSLGLQAGFKNQRSDYTNLVGSANDPRLNDASFSRTFFDMGIGVYFRTPRLHVGLSAPEIIPETVAVSDTIAINWSTSQYFLFAKYRIPLNQNLALEPSFLIKYFSNVPVSYDLNTNLIIKDVLSLGLSYRKNESLDFLLKAQLTPQLQVGYSYDHATGEVARLSNGSHEIMVNYVFKFTESSIVSPR